MVEKRELPYFRYHPNLYELDVLERFEGTCECCGEAGDLFYQGMYTSADVDYVCPWCIASGRAAEMLHGSFVSDAPRIDNPEATDELLHKTPGYTSWQGEAWVACCDDYCAYMGPVGTAELEEMGIADGLFEADGSLDGWEGARQDMVKNGWFTGHLFRYLHCWEVPPEGGRVVGRQSMWHEDDRMMGVYASLGNESGPFPRTCPACGERHAHILMHRFGSSSPRGAVWVWCDSCGGYARLGAVIPAWWRNPEFVDEDRLDSYVDYPDSIARLIDDWIGTFLDGVRNGD